MQDYKLFVISEYQVLRKYNSGMFMDQSIEGLISVIIPTYNAGAYIEKTLQSVFAQTYDNIEIIVVDDGSTDNTESLLKQYDNQKLRYIKQPNSGGPAGPRNVGIAAAKGEYIAIFDSDDLMEADKLNSQIKALESKPDAGFCCTNFSIIDDKDNITTPDFWSTNDNFQKLPKPHLDSFGNYHFSPGELTDSLLIHNFIASSSMVVRKKVFKKLGGFDETLENTDDYDMWLRILPLYSCILVPQVKHHYRVRAGNITSRGIHKLVDGRTTVLKRHLSKAVNKTTSLHVKKTIIRYQLSTGYYYFQQQDLKNAKKYYLQSIYILPTFNAFKYLASCIMGQRFINMARSLKNRN